MNNTKSGLKELALMLYPQYDLKMVENSFSSCLTGKLLIAMPSIYNHRFERTVVYLCAHNNDGAMGLIINQELDNTDFSDLAEQLNIRLSAEIGHIRVHFGGPVNSGRGFVLHSPEYERDGTLIVDDQMSLTATVDVLRSIAAGCGPRKQLFALGYAGWGPGQLDQEINENAWMIVDADESLVFDTGLEGKWDLALAKIGIHAGQLSMNMGHA